MPKIEVFLDSGAYSAWTSNQTIPLKDYIEFVREVERCVHTYANLDVIPGSIGRPRTNEEVEVSAEQSYRNLQIMKDAGLKPLPVFHQGESYNWLERMLTDGEHYIGISTAKNMPNPVQNRWLDEFFSVVTDSKGRPLIKVHGFGLAHVGLLRRYPFFSVDSAGWAIAGANGKIYVPPYRSGQPDYVADPEIVTISGNFQKSPHGQRRQLANLAYVRPDWFQATHRFLEEEVDINVGMARYCRLSRWRALAVYYQRVAESIQDVHFRHRLPSPFNGKVYELLKAWKPIEFDRLHFFFSTSYDLDNCAVLLDVGARNHLLSYWELKNRPEVLQAYAMEGKVNNNIRVRKPIKANWKDRRYRDRRGLALARRMLKWANELKTG